MPNAVKSGLQLFTYADSSERLFGLHAVMGRKLRKVDCSCSYVMTAVKGGFDCCHLLKTGKVG